MAGRSWLCLSALAVYVLAYLAALVVAFVGTKGLFGFQPDGLSAIWLIVLGLPWTSVLASTATESMPELAARALVGLAPVLNMLVLLMMCSKRRRNRY